MPGEENLLGFPGPWMGMQNMLQEHASCVRQDKLLCAHVIIFCRTCLHRWAQDMMYEICAGQRECVEEVWRLCGGRYECVRAAKASFESPRGGAGASTAAGASSASSSATTTKAAQGVEADANAALAKSLPSSAASSAAAAAAAAA